LACFDLLFKDASIYDGRGGEPFGADVGIQEGRIAVVGRLDGTKASRQVSLGGAALCPGFIDIHSHSDYSLLINPLAEGKVRQGVTTEVGGNCGYSAAPVAGPVLEERRQTYSRDYGLDLDFEDVRGYLGRLEREGLSVNYAHQVGHNTLRASFMGGGSRAPSSEELQAMAEGVAQAIQEGAFGFSTGLVYPPACYSSREELVTLASTAGRLGGFFSTHIRSEGKGLLEALEEVIAVSKASGAPLQVSHLKTAGKENWGKVGQALNLIETAVRDGVDVACDRYPYTASHTHLSALLPDWAHEGGKGRALERLKDPEDRRRIRGEMEAFRSGYWEDVLLCLIRNPRNKSFEGRKISEGAASAGKDEIDFVLDLLVDDKLSVEVILFLMDEGNLQTILGRPYVFIGSDAGGHAHYGPLGEGHPHPRGFGTFPRVLGRYAREEGLFPLAQAVAKMTLLPARRLGFRDRGVIQEGMAADLVVFDPDKIADTSTYDAPISYPKGIDMVVVNGEVTVEAGEHLGIRAGKPLRFSGRTR